MTKREFINMCIEEYRCTNKTARKWCGWADELHECDSAKADPDTGEVAEGEDPVKAPEDFLDEFVERLEVMTFAYGAETTAKTLSSSCYFPWEMMQAAEYISEGGNPKKAQAIAITGKFEESADDVMEYKRLKSDMERSREAGQSGQALT